MWTPTTRKEHRRSNERCDTDLTDQECGDRVQIFLRTGTSKPDDARRPAHAGEGTRLPARGFETGGIAPMLYYGLTRAASR
jgi:hypothetical protein